MLAAAPSPWVFHAHPDVWALVIGLGLGYWFVLARVGRRRLGPGVAVVAPHQVLSFLTGLAMMEVAAGWPVHDIAEKYLFSVHMVQHLLLSLVVPPLLLAGLPAWAVRWALVGRRLSPFVRRLTRPLPAAVLFNTVIVVTHYPALVDASLRSEPLHFLLHAVLFTCACIMWFPVLNRVRELPTMTYPGRMIYLFLQSVVPTVPASFLTFADGPVYRFYATVPRPFAISVVADQQLAGATMKIAGAAVLWGVIIVMFFRWYAETQHTGDDDVLTWDDVKRELDSTPPAQPTRD